MKDQTRQSIGVLGEDIAVKFLKSKGFTILQRNYLKPYGEIDIVCLKGEIVHFVEVKTVSRKTSKNTDDLARPEDNIHDRKLVRLSRVIEVYIEEQGIVLDWQFDVITVIIDNLKKTATVRLLSDLIIGT